MKARTREYKTQGENPKYLFRLTNEKILAAAIRGEIDLLQLAKNELHANRGYDANLIGIGFVNGEKLANTKTSPAIIPLEILDIAPESTAARLQELKDETDKLIDFIALRDFKEIKPIRLKIAELFDNLKA